MDLFQLETFMAVAEEKSFSRAAVNCTGLNLRSAR